VKPIAKVLVANRGEIAVRIIRACHEMGIRSVAVYSEADRDALHVRFAHEAYPIGPPEASRSYLDAQRILDVARRSGAEAIHPGYGFLSEDARFATACADAGLIFIGPPPAALEAVGDKVRARQTMIEAGVPVIPGSPPLGEDLTATARQAGTIGYPVLIKAAAGGGGKGMRVARSERELPSLLDQARGEARSAFGDPTVFLEKLIVRPRHIEVQVLADGQGACLALGERECSIQRRHQKLIEESPSPVVDQATRMSLQGLAIKAMRAVGYVNAGTVEFLRDDEGRFHFIEVNARLQVEHPVTEMVTGIDLVRAMIEIAGGGSVPLSQEQVELRGHAVECRIVAEDPARGFLPSPGTIRGLRTPSGPGIRYDDGTYAGWTVPVHYDPMIAKLVAWGFDRPESISRMARALDELRIDGLTTSVPLHRKVMAHRAFLEGDLHTGFLEAHPELVVPAADAWLDEIAVVAAAIAHFRRIEARSAAGAPGGDATARSAWRWRDRGWRA
jgi:acetyl-CoA carboxylase, biotin carboxylase subunit